MQLQQGFTIGGIVSNRRRFTLLDAIDDPQLFQPWFKDHTTWASWFTFLRALFGLPLTPQEFQIYQQCTGRTEAPTAPATEAWLVCGRRAGKSFMLALVAVYLACFHSYQQYFAPGERGTILIVSPDRKQSRVILRFIRALLMQVPMLARMVERETAEAFDLNNSVTIEVATASHRAVRGYAILAGLLDEAAFFPTDDAAEPDYEIINALRPGMATIPNATLLVASSPYAQRGSLYDAFKRHYGHDGDPILVWRAPTRTMNPTVPQSVIDAALEADPVSAAAEYLAEFRTDVETYISRDVVEAAVIQGRYESPRAEHVRYFAFVDPSGGSSDSMTLAVTHVQGNRVILDLIRERRAPFSPDDCVKEFSDTLKSFGISRIHGDRYAGEWPREAFRKCGIEYRVADKTKSDLYFSLLPLLNSGRVELLDHKRLVAQLCGLERRTSRGGKDSIDHVPGGHDDIANAVAGAAVISAQAAAHPQVKPVMPGVFSNGQWWGDVGVANTPTPAGYRPGNEPWRSFVTGPDIGRRTFGPPPGSGPREW
jgi:hypothetical protein